MNNHFKQNKNVPKGTNKESSEHSGDLHIPQIYPTKGPLSTAKTTTTTIPISSISTQAENEKTGAPATSCLTPQKTSTLKYAQPLLCI